MKRYYRSILSALAVAMLATACYEDKGNYDYRDIGEPTFTFESEWVNASVGVEVEVHPTVTFSDGSTDVDRLDYRWYLVSGDEERTEPSWNTLNFDWVADRVYGSGTLLRLEATDPVTGVQYIESVQLTVYGIYESDGVLVLAEKDGVSQFSFLKVTDAEFTPDYVQYVIKEVEEFRNVYSTENNGENLPAAPIRLREHFCYDSSTSGQLLALTGQGAVDINGQDFKRELLLSEVFEGGAYPEGFGYASDAMYMSFVNLVADQQGHVYSSVKSTSDLFYAGEYLSNRLVLDGEELTGCRFVMAPFSWFKACLVHDTAKQRLLLISDGATGAWDGIMAENAGKPIALENPAWTPEGFVPVDDLSGVNVLSIDYYRVDMSVPETGFSMVFERDGRYFCQEFVIEKASNECDYGVYYNPDDESDPYNPRIFELTGLPGAVTCAYGMPYRSNNRALLCAVGKELYVFDRGNPDSAPLKFDYEFPADIVAIDGENVYSRWMAVACADGTVVLANAANTTQGLSVVYKTFGDFGTIRDVRFKINGSNGWDVNH